jgi:hypothetical protein
MTWKREMDLTYLDNGSAVWIARTIDTEYGDRRLYTELSLYSPEGKQVPLLGEMTTIVEDDDHLRRLMAASRRYDSAQA